MALLKGKQADITFKKVELTEDNQKHSQKYLDKLNEILDYKRALDSRKNVAASQVKGLQEELETLNANYVLELDPGKQEAMDIQRRELKERISNLLLLANTDFKRVLKEKMDTKEVKDLAAAALNETAEYDKAVNELVEQLEDEIFRLQQSTREHLYLSTGYISNAITY